MDRILLDLGFLQIKWYSFFILTAILIAMFLFYKESKKKNLKEEYFVDITFYSVIFGILGARLYYVLFNMSYYLNNPLEILMIWNGGLAIHGGIIAGILFLNIYCKKKKINMLLLIDILVVGLIIGQAIGRWGNFFNSEAFGRVVSESSLVNLHIPRFIIDGMYIDGLYREPTFLYESLLSLLGFIVLLIVRRIKNLKTGMLTGIYLLWYGTTRIIIETLRSDSLMLGNFKIAQIISLLFIIIGIILLILSKKKSINYKEDKIIKD